jgi:MFS family permease
LTMPEANIQPHPHARQGVFAGMRATLLEALRFARGSTTLRTVFLVTIIIGAASESFDRLWQVHLLSFGLPRLESVFGGVKLEEAQSLLVSFAAIDLIVTLAGLPVARWAARVDASDPRAVARALLIVTSGAMIGVLGFALSPTLALAIAAFVVARVCREVHGPLSASWLNQRLEPSTRATVLSLNGQADAVGQIAGGPLIGAFGNASLRLAIACGAGIFGVCLPLYARASTNHAKVNREAVAD